jgi:hypothetical protein
MMVEHFRPGTVPILSSHGGRVLGFLDTLRADGPDLHFTATLTDRSARERFARGVGISIESAWGAPAGQPQPWAPGQSYPIGPAYAGTLREGPNLVGVALVEEGKQPAARGSVAWLIPD